jgi:hypothetical protein
MRVRNRSSVVVAAAGLALSACGSGAITADRLERALAPTFANLVHAQLTRMGLNAVPVSDLRVAASCYRVGGGDAGAGEWACMVVWAGPRGGTLRDGYEVTVGANGCYTATLSSAEAQLGGPTVTAADGRQVRNLLYAFDGCFDTM